MRPVTASSVMTAPLCGSVSMPPLAMAAMRCRTSSGMPAACAAAMKLSAIVARAMLMPPEADPVMPASAVTVTASLTSTPGIAFSPSATTRKPGSAAMTAPKPYSDAVLVAASSAPRDRGLASLGEALLERPEGEHHDGEDAEQERAFHRPDRRHRGHLGDHRLREAWQRA